MLIIKTVSTGYCYFKTSDNDVPYRLVWTIIYSMKMISLPLTHRLYRVKGFFFNEKFQGLLNCYKIVLFLTESTKTNSFPPDSYQIHQSRNSNFVQFSNMAVLFYFYGSPKISKWSIAQQRLNMLVFKYSLKQDHPVCSIIKIIDSQALIY